ncbi:MULTISPECIES: hypothetical protein [Xanthomonas]|uniref:DUF4175 domain-containing protein n=1 Tax=Xanthomonas rydalmerensis TaxID=3046274 RepID=A0ABZ0JMV7_9XANT|nr:MULTISPECIES: hypothetical protein [unclassified Xanthomonas]MBB5877845.1 putative membrane protein YccC [Xanthomonas sp. 3498]MBB5942109.1 putative membrane protein YccC [Xanthomonas sp. 3307]MXV07905.1 hypothetical protein [Xanthomonas sp. LMG 9002]WOS40756.1 hypothetical protein QN243_20585 [Xanthomonas sp. DM-2023]WOS44940.1 hypothetical protein QN242_20585 [Xanthomonas sp. DM-2023]
MTEPRLPPAKTRALSLGLFVFVAVFAAIVWSLLRPYGSVYFFPVHFLVGLGLPFLFYALGANRAAFLAGLGLTAIVLVLFNLWGDQAGGLGPRVFDWAHAVAGGLGMLLAYGVFRLSTRVRQRHPR